MSTVLHAAPVVLGASLADREPTEPLIDGAVLVVDGVIADVGSADRISRTAGASVRRRDHAGILTPGLINAHAHLQYSSYADLASSGLPFSPWIAEMVRRRAATSPEQWAESARLGAHLALRSGTTAVADIVTDAPALLPLARSGLRGISYVEALGADDALWDAERQEGVEGMLDSAPLGRVTGVSPHSLYTLSRRAFTESVQVGRDRGMRIHTHLSESADETEFIAVGTGRLAALSHAAGWAMDVVACGGAGHTPAAEMDALGGLGPDVHVAHGVHCTAQDRQLLRDRQTAVALCVRSNRILKAGRPPIADYLAEGSPIALGTDSLASSPSLDLLEEARAARDLALAQGYDHQDLHRRLFAAMTTGGAFALGMDGRARPDGTQALRLGILEVGAPADLAIFDVPTQPWDSEPYDAYRSLIEFGAGGCTGTVISGKFHHRRGAGAA